MCARLVADKLHSNNKATWVNACGLLATRMQGLKKRGYRAGRKKVGRRLDTHYSSSANYI